MSTGSAGHQRVWRQKGVRDVRFPWRLPLLDTLVLAHYGHDSEPGRVHTLLEDDKQGLEWDLILTIITRPSLYLSPFLRLLARALPLRRQYYGATFFMATGFHGAHVIIGSIFLIVCLLRALAGHFTPKQHLASSSPPGTGTSSTWYGCSCSPAYMCGDPVHRIRSEQSRYFLKGRRHHAALLF